MAQRPTYRTLRVLTVIAELKVTGGMSLHVDFAAGVTSVCQPAKAARQARTINSAFCRELPFTNHLP